MAADYTLRTNTIKFGADLRKFSEQTGIAARLVRKKIADDIWAGIHNPSVHPLDTGRARLGWMMTDGSPSTFVPPRGVYGVPSKPAASQPAIFANDFDVTWIVNNVPYINKLEFDGHSRQAPNGWVRTVVAAVETRIISRGAPTL